MIQAKDIDFTPKTNEEIRKMRIEWEKEMMTEWVSEIARLWDAVGKPLDETRLNIYKRELSDIPLGLLERAVSRVIRENTYSNVPPVGAIWKAVRVELGIGHKDDTTDVLDAIEDWKERSRQRCLVRFNGVAVETDV